MGTRADFYVGRGEKAEWLGSIAYDGYPEGLTGDDGVGESLVATPCGSEAEWRERVAKFLASRENSTQVADGWPWPWTDSGTTDWAYAFDGAVVYLSCFGRAWLAFAEFDAKTKEVERLIEAAEAAGDDDARAAIDEEWWDKIRPKAAHPDMKAVQKVTLGPRSGMIVMRG